MPSSVATIWAGKRGKAEQSDQVIWRWDVAGCRHGEGMRLKACLGEMNSKSRCTLFLAACSADLQARPNSTHANELNNEWRLAKHCWLPSGCLSPCRSNSTRAHVIYTHIATPKPFISIIGYFSVSDLLRFWIKEKKHTWNLNNEMGKKSSDLPLI